MKNHRLMKGSYHKNLKWYNKKLIKLEEQLKAVILEEGAIRSDLEEHKKQLTEEYIDGELIVRIDGRRVQISGNTLTEQFVSNLRLIKEGSY